MYYITEGPFRMVAGDYCGDLLTFSWSVRVYSLFESHFSRSCDSFPFFIYDILQATSCILNIRWIHNGIVEAGSYCTIQGIIAQTGELGVGLITLV
jgi:hypothetical protein